MRTLEAIGIAVALGATAVSGLWLAFLAFRRVHSSRWLRQVTVTCGIAGLLSTAGHALLLLQPHRFDRARRFEVQTFSMVLGGVWLGLLISLLCSRELWDSHSTPVDNQREEP